MVIVGQFIDLRGDENPKIFKRKSVFLNPKSGSDAISNGSNAGFRKEYRSFILIHPKAYDLMKNMHGVSYEIARFVCGSKTKN